MVMMSLMGSSPVVTHCGHFIRKHLSVCLYELSRTRLLALMLISQTAEEADDLFEFMTVESSRYVCSPVRCRQVAVSEL